MTKKNLALKSTLSMGLGTVLGCVLAVNSPPGQSGAINSGDKSEITSSPGENPQVDDGIDYENAKPMPLPSVPAPPNSKTPPGIPSTGPIQGTPGSSPGNTGSGEENPRVLVPHRRNPLQGR